MSSSISSVPVEVCGWPDGRETEVTVAGGTARATEGVVGALVNVSVVVCGVESPSPAGSGAVDITPV